MAWSLGIVKDPGGWAFPLPTSTPLVLFSTNLQSVWAWCPWVLEPARRHTEPGGGEDGYSHAGGEPAPWSRLRDQSPRRSGDVVQSGSRSSPRPSISKPEWGESHQKVRNSPEKSPESRCVFLVATTPHTQVHPPERVGVAGEMLMRVMVWWCRSDSCSPVAPPERGSIGHKKCEASPSSPFRTRATAPAQFTSSQRTTAPLFLLPPPPPFLTDVM